MTTIFNNTKGLALLYPVTALSNGRNIFESLHKLFFIGDGSLLGTILMVVHVALEDAISLYLPQCAVCVYWIGD